jgi:hypothetical protein
MVAAVVSLPAPEWFHEAIQEDRIEAPGVGRGQIEQEGPNCTV